MFWCRFLSKKFVKQHGLMLVLLLSSNCAAVLSQTAPAPAAKTEATAPAAAPVKPPASVYDGFESPTLGNMWMTLLLAPGVVCHRVLHCARRAQRPAHCGAAARLFHGGRPGDLGTERDELLEAYPYWTHTNAPFEFSWSMYLPEDFPIVPVRLVVAQWWE